MPALSGMRPAALQEPQPLEGLWRHTEIGYKLVLKPVLPPLGEEVPEVRASAFIRAVDGDDEDMRQLASVSRARNEAEKAASSSRGKRRKKRKRRRKKTPKSSSSALLPRRRAGDQGIMLEYADDETEDVLEYVQRADGPRNFHTVAAYTSHAEPPTSAHSTEDAGYLGPGEAAPGMEEVNKLIKETVITGDISEEIILKNGLLVSSLYSDRTHLYISP